MESHDLIFSCAALGGDRVRVIIVDDTISLPYHNWSHCGYGAHISVEWMLGQCPHKLPGSKATRRALAGVIVGALEEAARRNKQSGAAFAEMNAAVGQLVEELTEATVADLPLCRKCDAPLDGGDPDEGLCAMHLTEQAHRDVATASMLLAYGLNPGRPVDLDMLRARRDAAIGALYAEAKARDNESRQAGLIIRKHIFGAAQEEERVLEDDFFSFARAAGLVASGGEE